jgi:hypothetical protein
MNSDDPLIRLLRTADTAAAPPSASPDLVSRIHRRHTRRLAHNRLKLASATLAAATIAIIVSLRPWQPPAPPGGDAPNSVTIAQRPSAEPRAIGPQSAASGLPDAEIAQLRAEAEALSAEAAALERQIAAARAEQSRQDIREEYRHQLAANATAEAGQSPIDRAAAIALCQGDFYWEVQQNRAPAQAAYQSILDNFPTSSLASVAQARLQQLQMN